jgi:thymidylate synthase
MYTINKGEHGYLDLLDYILQNGNDKSDRTGVGTRSIFGAQLHFPLYEGFPLLTTKKMFHRGMFAELAWLIRGETNVRSLQDQDVHIWDEWADENGDLGPIYGKQWRSWDAVNGVEFDDDHEPQISYMFIDQLQNALDLIKNDPDSRRIVVSAWNPADNSYMALTPCHAMFQFEVHSGAVSCHMYQRSADVFLGVPFNIASYAALTHVMAHLADLRPGELTVSFGDVHIYNNHFDQVREQLSRRNDVRFFPQLELTHDLQSLDDVRTETFKVVNYDPHPSIKAEVAV